MFRKNTSPFAINGVSDILGILPGGRFLAIEVKSKRGRTTIEQEMFMANVNYSGGLAFCARSVEEVERMLKETLWAP